MNIGDRVTAQDVALQMRDQDSLAYLREALAGVRDVATWYAEQVERLAPTPPGHESYGETKGDGSDYCECGEFLGHDFPPEETERRWVAHRLALAEAARG